MFKAPTVVQDIREKGWPIRTPTLTWCLILSCGRGMVMNMRVSQLKLSPNIKGPTFMIVIWKDLPVQHSGEFEVCQCFITTSHLITVHVPRATIWVLLFRARCVVWALIHGAPSVRPINFTILVRSTRLVNFQWGYAKSDWGRGSSGHRCPSTSPQAFRSGADTCLDFWANGSGTRRKTEQQWYLNACRAN